MDRERPRDIYMSLQARLGLKLRLQAHRGAVGLCQEGLRSPFIMYTFNNLQTCLEVPPIIDKSTKGIIDGCTVANKVEKHYVYIILYFLNQVLYSIPFFRCFPGSSVSSRLDPCHRVQVQNQRAQHPLSLQEEQGGRPRQVGRRHDQVLLQRRHLPHAGRRATSPFAITKASSFHNNYFFLF